MKVGFSGILAAVLMVGSLASAANKVWTGAVNANWNTAGNWIPNGVPGGSDLEVFGPAGGTCVVDVARWNGSLPNGGLLFTNAPFTLSVPTASPQTPFDIGSQGIRLEFPGEVTFALVYYLYLEGSQTWFVTNSATLTITNSGNLAWYNPTTKTGQGLAQLRGSGVGGSPGALAVNEGTFLVNVSGGSGVALTSLTCAAGATFSLTENPSGNPFRIRNLSDCTFAGTLSGATAAADYNAFKKDGWGALKFSGQGRYSNTGNIYLKGGPLVLDYTGSGNFGVNKITDAVTLYVDNGVIELDGADDGAVSETLGSLVFGAKNCTAEGGMAGITIVPGSQPTTVTFPNGTVWYDSSSGGGGNELGGMCRFKGVDGTANRVMLASANVANNSILGGFAHVVQGSTVDFAAYYHTGSGGRTGVCQLAESGRPTAFAAGNNTLLTAGHTDLSGATTTYSLKVKGSQTINLGGGTNTLDSGGIIQTGSAGDSTVISNGTLSVGQVKSGGYTTGHLFVHADRDVTLDCTVTGLHASNGGVAKSGAGKLTLPATATLNRYAIRFYEGSVDYEINQDCLLYGSGGGYGPASGVISNAGTLTKGGANTMTIQNSEVCCGTINVNGGVLAAAVDGGYALTRLRVLGAGGSNGQINVASGAKLWYPKDETWTATDFGGSGTMTMNSAVTGLGTPYTLTGAGGVWGPGSTGIAGLLTVQGTLAWASNGTTRSALEIHIVNTDTNAGTGYDRLVVTGKVFGLSTNITPNKSAVDLVVKVASNLRGIDANTYTILTAATNFAGLAFNNVVWDTPMSTGTVNYLNGSITLTNVKVLLKTGTMFMVR